MAFDQPLEADRVDNSFFMSLVHAPVGAILWVLGDRGSKPHVQPQDVLAAATAISDSLDATMSKDVRVEHPAPLSDKSLDAVSELRQVPPSMLSSEISDSTMYALGGSEKHLSWSNELVNYDDESSRHEPPRSDSAPPRSALVRSCSVTHQMGTSSSAAGASSGHSSLHQQQQHYLPRGLMKPATTAQQLQTTAEESGLESPQWGWYIRTTPPTPEMYHAHSSQRHHLPPIPKKSSSQSSAASTVSTTSSSSSSSSVQVGAPPVHGGMLPPSHYYRPNPIFQGIQEKKKNGMGWPSVPL